MNLLKNYDIDVSKLNLGQHEFRFQIEDTFFELFDYSLIEHGSLSALIVLEKKTSFLSLNFSISGTVELVCDRSLDLFDYGLSLDNKIIFRYGDEAKVVSDELEIIPSNKQKINIADYLYEFIGVAVPMKKLHPRFTDEPEDNQIVFTSGNDVEEASEIDPRWGELKKLKNKNKF